MSGGTFQIGKAIGIEVGKQDFAGAFQLSVAIGIDREKLTGFRMQQFDAERLGGGDAEVDRLVGIAGTAVQGMVEPYGLEGIAGGEAGVRYCDFGSVAAGLRIGAQRP